MGQESSPAPFRRSATSAFKSQGFSIFSRLPSNNGSLCGWFTGIGEIGLGLVTVIMCRKSIALIVFFVAGLFAGPRSFADQSYLGSCQGQRH